MPEINVKAYVRNGKLVRSYRRVGKAGRGRAAGDGGKITKVGKAGPLHSWTDALVSVNGVSPKVSVGYASGRVVVNVSAPGANVDAATKRVFEEMARAATDAVKAWVDSKPSALYKVVRRDPIVKRFDPSLAFQEPVWSSKTRGIVTKAYEKVVKANSK